MLPELADNPGTTSGNCPLCMYLSSPLWSTVVRGLRRVFQAIEQQALLRVIAPSRRDQDRERILVLPRLFALLFWQ